MNKYRTELKWALIFTGMMFLWMIGERLTGLHDVHIDKHPIFTNFVAIPAIIIFVLALREKRDKDLDGKMTWMQGFISGLIISVIIAVLSPLMQFITLTYVSPQYFENAIAYSVESGNATQEEAESFFNLNSYLIMGAIGSIFMGMVTSAIVAIFVRKS
ncbi:DUF4199 domain-containing protein [Lewinella sp. W8]|uniref:DUF4199 domain-containing protein n=1 Tax=Lewinella sp. W8 TaxID=2528208 RepID=UPI00106880B7|nr:DUF4199 domain-containing protein [Lewinella sp. W8]MTB52010.1 DUF4199 family protein [Lewinella sp. W8]